MEHSSRDSAFSFNDCCSTILAAIWVTSWLMALLSNPLERTIVVRLTETAFAWISILTSQYLALCTTWLCNSFNFFLATLSHRWHSLNASAAYANARLCSSTLAAAMVAFTLATYLDELRNLPTEKPLEPELKAEQQKQDVKIRSEAIAQHPDAISAL